MLDGFLLPVCHLRPARLLGPFVLSKYLYNPACHLLLAITLGIIGYSNTLNAPFQLDDLDNIVNNPIIKNLDYYSTPSKAKIYNRVLTEYPLLINRYVGSLSFALNYRIHGLDVTGYHVINLLIHLTNTFLAYWLITLILITLASGTGRDKPLPLKQIRIIAFFSTLLFATHPIQTQAVTYIVQRFASLATMFYLLSMVMYARARLRTNSYTGVNHGKKIGTKGIVYYLISLFSAVLAMKTKEIAFTLPVMIILYEFIFIKDVFKKRVVYLTPFVLTMFIIPSTLIYIVGLGGVTGEVTKLTTDISRIDYFYTEARVIITYIRLIFLPVNQNLDYDYQIYHSIFNNEVILSLVAISTICFTVIYLFWRCRKDFPLIRVILFATAWYFVTISIESSVIPIPDVIFEHRMYLPSLGIFLLISITLTMVTEKYKPIWSDKITFLSVIVIASILTGITYSRNNVWNDEIMLWQDIVKKSPGKARGHYNLALEYVERGLLDESVKELRSAIKINPINTAAHYNLGCIYYNQGLIDESIESFKNAIKIDPSYANAHYNLGGAYLKKGLIEKANAELRISKMLENHKYQSR